MSIGSSRQNSSQREFEIGADIKSALQDRLHGDAGDIDVAELMRRDGRADAQAICSIIAWSRARSASLIFRKPLRFKNGRRRVAGLTPVRFSISIH